MNQGNFLKYTRRTLAIVLGGAMTAVFLDLTHVLPEQLTVLADMQIVPLIMKGAIGAVAFMLLIALLFGRVYCSILCPLGILQDVIGAVKKWGYKILGKRKALKMKYGRPLNVIRYGMFALVVIPYALGLSLPLLITDPYSNFGRIATSMFRPVAVWINNALAGMMNQAGNYSLYVVRNIDTGGMVAILSAALLVVLVVMVWMRGRLWCNTICPVGTLLGFLSRFSYFRIRIDKESCNSCAACSSVCKAQCIDHASKSVDTSRCVACFNCLGNCKKSAILYVGSVKPSAKHVIVTPVAAIDAPVNPCKNTRDQLSEEGLARRNFIKGSLLTLSALPAAMLIANGKQAEPERINKRSILPLPPGAISRERFVSKCTACQLCVTACPTQVLQPAFMENGLTGVMQPYMRFKVESFCNYECMECLKVCPNHAIVHLTLEEKKLTRVGVAHFKKGRCVVYEKHQDCGACAEHCPTQAVHMVPYEDGLTIPRVEPQYCIGCGGCESICPVTPVTAIFVEGLDVQQIAEPMKIDESDSGTVTDFGF